VPNVQWKTPDDGQRYCPKHVEFLDKNKFGKLVRLLVLLKRNKPIELSVDTRHPPLSSNTKNCRSKLKEEAPHSEPYCPTERYAEATSRQETVFRV